MKWDQNNPEKVKDFIAKMKQDYAFKKAYAARRAWEFYNHPDVAGMCYVAVGGLDSITLFLFLRSIGIDVPGTSVSMLEDRSIQKVHKALGIRALRPANGPKDRPYTKIEVIREHGFPVLSKEIAGKISLLQHPSEKNATVRHAIMTGETGAYGGYRKNTRMKMSQKWLEKFGGPENEKYGTNYQTAPFKVSDLCCYYLKEKPCNDYARSSRRFPYMGLMASEGGRRQKALMLNGYRGEVRNQISMTEYKLMAISESVHDSKIDRLKSQDMLKADDSADRILDASEKDVLGMVIDDAKENIDKKMEEEQKKAEEAAKKRDEQQERIDDSKQDAREQREIIRNDAKTDMLDINNGLSGKDVNNVEEVQKHIQKMLNDEKLINEDLKGIRIDFNY